MWSDVSTTNNDKTTHKKRKHFYCNDNGQSFVTKLPLYGKQLNIYTHIYANVLFRLLAANFLLFRLVWFLFIGASCWTNVYLVVTLRLKDLRRPTLTRDMLISLSYLGSIPSSPSSRRRQFVRRGREKTKTQLFHTTTDQLDCLQMPMRSQHPTQPRSFTHTRARASKFRDFFASTTTRLYDRVQQLAANVSSRELKEIFTASRSSVVGLLCRPSGQTEPAPVPVPAPAPVWVP